MSTKRDYYEVLGVPKGAAAEDIKRAYRRLARQHHPDVNKDDHNAEEVFKEINEAYEVLSDPQKRQMYDAYGHQSMNGRYAGPGFGFDGFGDLGGFGDIFDLFFGRGNRAETRRPTIGEPGDDLRYDLEITLEEASTGVEKELRMSRLERCEICSGSGGKPESSIDTCPICQGSGQVRHSQQTILGSFSTVSTCTTCHGEGRIIKEPCQTCGGSGRTRATTVRKAQVVPGIGSGSRIRIRGEGDAGLRGGPTGDLYVVVYIRPHKIFERQGDDILCEIPISFVQAALGDSIEVPTLYGDEQLHFPEGTQTGATFRLRGKGMPNVSSGTPGDQHVVVRVAVPSKLNDEQKKLLYEFGKSCGVELNPESHKSFFEKLFGKENRKKQGRK